MKKIRGKPKGKKKATNGKRRTVKAANTSLQQFDERLSQIEQDVELNRRGLLALEQRVGVAQTPSPAVPTTSGVEKPPAQGGLA